MYLVVLRLTAPLLFAALHDRLLLLGRFDGARDRRPLRIDDLNIVLLRPFATDHFLKGLAEYIGHLCMEFALTRIFISSLCQPLKSSKAES